MSSSHARCIVWVAAIVTSTFSGCCSHDPPTLAEFQAGVDTLLERAEEQIEADDWQAAYASHREALRLAPDSAYVYARIAYALSEEDPRGAIRALDQAIARQSVHVWTEIAPDRFTMGFDEDTLAFLTFNRGRAWSSLGDTERALADFERARSLRPDQAWWEKQTFSAEWNPTTQITAVRASLKQAPAPR